MVMSFQSTLFSKIMNGFLLRKARICHDHGQNATITFQEMKLKWSKVQKNKTQ